MQLASGAQAHPLHGQARHGDSGLRPPQRLAHAPVITGKEHRHQQVRSHCRPNLPPSLNNTERHTGLASSSRTSASCARRPSLRCMGCSNLCPTRAKAPTTLSNNLFGAAMLYHGEYANTQSILGSSRQVCCHRAWPRRCQRPAHGLKRWGMLHQSRSMRCALQRCSSASMRWFQSCAA